MDRLSNKGTLGVFALVIMVGCGGEIGGTVVASEGRGSGPEGVGGPRTQETGGSGETEGDPAAPDGQDFVPPSGDPVSDGDSPQPGPAPDPQPPSSTSHSVYWVGHSLVGPSMPQMVGEIAQSLGLQYSWDAQIINGAPLKWNWENSHEADSNSRAVLPNGGFDVLVITEAVKIIDHTTHNDTHHYAGNFHDLIAGQPGAQTYLYETWSCLATGTPEGCMYDENDHLRWRERIEDDRPRFDAVVDAVNASRGGNPMILAPVGTAMGYLHDEIEAGNMPGVSRIEDLFSDLIHPNNAGFYFIALMHTATIYGADVRGAAVSLHDQWGSPYPGLPSPALAEAMQNLVFELTR